MTEKDTGGLLPGETYHTELAIKMFGLTRVEAEVALYIALGNGQKKIAAILGKRPETIRDQAKGIYKKVRPVVGNDDVHSENLLLYFLHNGILDIPKSEFPLD